MSETKKLSKREQKRENELLKQQRLEEVKDIRHFQKEISWSQRHEGR